MKEVHNWKEGAVQPQSTIEFTKFSNISTRTKEINRFLEFKPAKEVIDNPNRHT